MEMAEALDTPAYCMLEPRRHFRIARTRRPRFTPASPTEFCRSGFDSDRSTRIACLRARVSSPNSYA